MSLAVSWNDPWPPPQPAWGDPPWALSGRAVTAWFDAPREVVAGCLSPDLLPDGGEFRVRFRFYDLAFEVRGPAAGQPLAPHAGRFREAAFGVPAAVEGVRGETSTFLWTDSLTYLMWGREAFGWPLRHGQFEFEGTLWDTSFAALEKASGTALLTEEWGSARLSDVQIHEALASQHGGTVNWLTPRRVLERAGKETERRELLVVRPVVERPGTRYGGRGALEFDFSPPHPLAPLRELAVEIDVADGFQLLVGEDVDVITSPATARSGSAA